MSKIAKYLLEINAIKIDTTNFFSWASKIKSPIYTDNRLIISFPKYRKKIEKAFSQLIIKNFPDVDFLVGVATSGIPHCAYVSSILNLPMGYTRNSQKAHGKQNIIEGNLEKAKNIVVIEDLFSTGQSSLNVINILKENKYNVIGIASIFSYELNILQKNFQNIKYKSLLTISELIKTSLEEKKLTLSDVNIIEKFLLELNNLQ